MVTMTFQYGRFFRFNLILLENFTFYFVNVSKSKKQLFSPHLKKSLVYNFLILKKRVLLQLKNFYATDFFKNGPNSCFCYLKTFNKIKSGGH